MPNYDWECENGHIFERTSHYRTHKIKCRECGEFAERIWMAPRSPHRQLQTPIIMWKYADGSLGVAGGADSRTPPNAERIELRSVGEYRRHAHILNNQLRGREQRREEAFLAMREQMEKHQRSELAWKMANESDPIAKDIYREALERTPARRGSADLREFFSVAMEMDKSNYE